MAANRIRKAAKRNPEGCLTLRAPLAQRVGIPKPIEASGDQHPTGRRKRPLGTASKAVKDTLSVTILSRRFSGFCGKACKDDPLGGKSASSLTHLVWLQKLLFVVQRWKGKRG